MAMLPQIARLPSGSSSRRRWSLALLGVAILGLPTWYETAQSQETVKNQPATGKPPISKETTSKEVNSEKVSGTDPLAKSAHSKAANQGGRFRGGGMGGGGAGGMGGGLTASKSSEKKNLQVKVLSEAPAIEFQPQPSEAERKILDQLNQRVDRDLKDQTLIEFCQILGQEYSLNVIIDNEKLEEESIAADAAVNTLKVKDVSLRSVLKLVLDRQKLSFYIEDEVLKVTTITDVSGRRSTRTYPVGDLITSCDDLESLVDAIQQIVTPGDWADDEERSSQISMVPNMGTLIVRQTLPGHDEVLDLLRSLRKTKAETGIVKGMGAAKGVEAGQRLNGKRVSTGGGFY